MFPYGKKSSWWLRYQDYREDEKTPAINERLRNSIASIYLFATNMLSISATHSHDRFRHDDTHMAQCWCCRRSTFRLSIFVFFLIAYLAIGAVCFMWIETPYEMKEKQMLIDYRTRFLHRHPCITDHDLEELFHVVHRAIDRGIPIRNNASYSDFTWNFGQSIFFASTVVTTVGYGHVAPLSQGGKLFCVFFAMVGIPLTLILFTAIIERLSMPAEKLFYFIRNRVPERVSDFHVKVIHLIFFVFIHVVIITLVPAAIFDYIEKDWSYLDSVYFCFITWTTIGLGDFVPGEKPYQPYRWLYKVIASLYMFVSLISMLFVLKTFHDTPHLNLGARVYMESDIRSNEVLPLQPGDKGPKYTRHTDETSSTNDLQTNSSNTATATATFLQDTNTSHAQPTVLNTSIQRRDTTETQASNDDKNITNGKVTDR